MYCPTFTGRPSPDGGPLDRAVILAAAWRAEGFVEGPPPGARPERLAVDRLACRHMRCPRCRRCLAARPYHAAGGRYRVLAACDGCGFGEEM